MAKKQVAETIEDVKNIELVEMEEKEEDAILNSIPEVDKNL